MKRAVLLAGLLTLIGCEKKLSERAHEYKDPEYGFLMYRNGYDVDYDLMWNKYKDVAECLEIDDPELMIGSFVTEIVDYEIRPNGNQGFPCDASPTGWCAGLYDPNISRIYSPPALAAFGHEVAHHLSGEYGHPPIIQECGDAIDSLYNAQELTLDMSHDVLEH